MRLLLIAGLRHFPKALPCWQLRREFCRCAAVRHRQGGLLEASHRVQGAGQTAWASQGLPSCPPGLPCSIQSPAECSSSLVVHQPLHTPPSFYSHELGNIKVTWPGVQWASRWAGQSLKPHPLPVGKGSGGENSWDTPNHFNSQHPPWQCSHVRAYGDYK